MLGGSTVLLYKGTFRKLLIKNGGGIDKDKEGGLFMKYFLGLEAVGGWSELQRK